MRTLHKHRLRNIALFIVASGLLILGILIFWLATLRLPDFKSFGDRKTIQSTKIYDRTGQIMLYDLNQDIKRTDIAFDAMGTNIKNATVAIEDSGFYEHSGIKITSILRAVIVNLLHGKFSQGGSTITQQVIKNTVLTSQKSITRKLKEWMLAVKLDREMGKEQILALYINGAPYGGSIYGVEEASKIYFDKEPTDLTIAESAYLAAIPNAPTYYSPFGKHKDALEARKNLVLSREHELKFITDAEYAAAKAETVTFQPQQTTGIKAPHFVFFIKDYLVDKYGEDMAVNGGLKVITTLNYGMQARAEEIAKRYALANETKYQASNAAIVAIDPKTGQILTMVGSRDYFDKNIDGNYNIATAHRQPGSSFKPFVYATGFNMGYTPDTVLYDTPTEFNPDCPPSATSTKSTCYNPANFDGRYRGPMTVRNALAMSINIPGVKMLYLVGINNAIKTAEDMGITSLKTAATYGLTLVLGGGEVRLLDMTSAYGVFATNGLRHPATGILSVSNNSGTVLESFADSPEQVLPKQTALEISEILADNAARTPEFGANSSLYVKNYDVAVKTGTTNDYKDAWIIGYTPALVVGAWVGNNDNKPMARQISSILSAPMWHEFIAGELAKIPDERFEKPAPYDDPTLKPILRGLWQGNESFVIDTVSGGLATALTPKETQKEKVITNVHDILYWVNKSDPTGPMPGNPASDGQFTNWEYSAQNWWSGHAGNYPFVTLAEKPTFTDTVHTEATRPTVAIITPIAGTHYAGSSELTIAISLSGPSPLRKADYYLNDIYLGTSTNGTFSFVPNSVTNVSTDNELKVIGYDIVYSSNTATMPLSLDL